MGYATGVSQNLYIYVYIYMYISSIIFQTKNGPELLQNSLRLDVNRCVRKLSTKSIIPDGSRAPRMRFWSCYFFLWGGILKVWNNYEQLKQKNKVSDRIGPYDDTGVWNRDIKQVRHTYATRTYQNKINIKHK